VSVTAAAVVVNVPQAGERLAFEQRLVPPGEPLTVEIRYQTRSPP
jgi:hypothetical protein